MPDLPIPKPQKSMKDLSDRAGVIIDTLEQLSDENKEIVLGMVKVAFPKLKGAQRIKKNSEEDLKIIKGDIPNISGGPKLSEY